MTITQQELDKILDNVRNNRITTLNLSSTEDITLGQLIQIAEALKINTSLTDFNLAHTKIGIAGIQVIAEVLKINKSLTTLRLWYNNIGDEGVLIIAEALKTNTTLTSLNIQNNQITAIGAQAIAEILRDNCLTMLDLSNNKIGDDGAQVIFESLKTNTTLTSLTIANNQVSDEGLKAIADTLEINTSLATLYLGQNNVGSEGSSKGLKAIAAALEKNITLTTLNLWGDQISDEGAKAFANALERNISLTRLYLYNSNIGDEGAKALAAALEKNTNLTLLFFQTSNISDEGAKAFATALENNTSLTHLDFMHSKIGDEGAKAIIAALENNTSLTYLAIWGGNNIGDEGAKAIAAFLEKNTTLDYLNIQNHNISDEGAKAIIAALEKNTSITYCGLVGVQISADLQSKIRALIERNASVRHNFLALTKKTLDHESHLPVLLEEIPKIPATHQIYTLLQMIVEAGKLSKASKDITNYLKMIEFLVSHNVPINSAVLQEASRSKNPKIQQLIQPNLQKKEQSISQKSSTTLLKDMTNKPLQPNPITKAVANNPVTESKIQKTSEEITIEQQITKLQQQHQKAEAEIARISSQQSSSTSQFLSSPPTIDPKFTKTRADIAEQEHIKSKPHLLQYYNIIQKTFNEAFLFSNILSQGGVVLSQGAVARSLGAMATLAGDIPFASVILSIAQSATDSFTSAKRAGKYTNISDLNPNSDPIDSALLVEELARRFTITNAAKIESIAAGRGAAELSDIRQFISRVKEDTKAQIAKQDPAMARGLFGTEKTSAELLAYKDSRTALEYILNGQLQDKSSRTTIIKEIVEAVTGLEEKRLITTIPPSTTQIKKSATTTSLITPSIVNPTSVPTPELSPIIQGASQLSSGTDIERILRITEDRAKAREKAHAEEIKKALEDQAKMLEEKMRKAQEEQAKAHTEAIRKLRAVEAESGQTKKTLEAVFQTVISGNDDQVTGAVRTREGATISVINPNLEARVSGIHQEHDEHREEVHNRLSHLERERSRRSKKSKTKCCVIL